MAGDPYASIATTAEPGDPYASIATSAADKADDPYAAIATSAEADPYASISTPAAPKKGVLATLSDNQEKMNESYRKMGQAGFNDFMESPAGQKPLVNLPPDYPHGATLGIPSYLNPEEYSHVLYRGLAPAVSSQTSPSNLLTLGVLGAGKGIFQRVVSAYFAGTMAQEFGKQAGELMDIIHDPNATWQDKGAKIIQTLTTGGFMAGAAGGAARPGVLSEGVPEIPKPEVPPAPEKIFAPAEPPAAGAEALQATNDAARRLERRAEVQAALNEVGENQTPQAAEGLAGNLVRQEREATAAAQRAADFEKAKAEELQQGMQAGQAAGPETVKPGGPSGLGEGADAALAQLLKLDNELGVGVGAVKERARLFKVIEDAKAARVGVLANEGGPALSAQAQRVAGEEVEPGAPIVPARQRGVLSEPAPISPPTETPPQTEIPAAPTAPAKAEEAQVAPVEPVNIGKRPRGPLSDQTGAINPSALLSGPGRTALGAVAGGIYGSTQGDTPEERIKNMLKFGIGGGALAYGTGKLVGMGGEGSFAESALGQLWSKVRTGVSRISSDAAPITSSKSPESGNALVRYVAANNAKQPVARSMATDVLGSNHADKAFDQKLGAIVVEERLRGIRAGLEKAAANAKTPEEIADFKQRAADVQTLVGEGGKFRNEAEYQAALKESDISQALERHKGTVQATAEEAHAAAGGKLAGAGPQTGVFVNLQAVLGDNPEADFKKTGMNVGDLVQAPDRQNFGRVIGANKDGTAQVHFVNPDTLAEATVNFHPNDLTVKQTAADAAESGVLTNVGVSSGGSRRGNLENPLRKATVFGKQAKGTAEEYNTSYREIAERMVKGNFEEMAKRDLYDQLQKDGLAKEQTPGQPAPEFNGKKAAVTTIERRGQMPQTGQSITKIVKLFYDPDIKGELRQALDTDGPVARNGLTWLAKVVNSVQLAAPTDAIFHTGNQIMRIAGAQGGKSMLADMVRMRPGLNVVDAVGRMVWKAHQVLADSPEIQRQIADLAETGAMRPPHEFPELTLNPRTWKPSGRLISLLDQSGRLVGDDLYQNLVKRGLADNSEGARRDFINKMGNYEPRLMGPFMRFFKESGLSPFIVAGRNFNQLAAERVMLSPGVRAADTASAAKMRAINAAGAIADVLIFPAAMNYLTTGNPLGRPGTPFGAIDTGKDKDNGDRLVIDLLQWTGFRRGMRMTGLNALATGIREGQPAKEIAGNAVRDSVGTIIHPWVGPLPRVASTMLGAPRPLGAAKAGETGGQNVLRGAEQLSPLTSSFFEGKERSATNRAGAKNILSSWGTAAGIKGARPYTNEAEVYGMVDRYKDANNIKTKPTAGEADYSGLTNALRGTDKDAQTVELTNLLESKSPQQVAGYFPHFADRPFTGNHADEARFLKGLTPEQRQTYDQAVEDRRTIAKKGMQLVQEHMEAHPDKEGVAPALAEQAAGKMSIDEGIRSIAEKIKAAAPEDREGMLTQLAAHPAIFKAVANHIRGVTEDLEPSEQSIKALGVENGARAKFLKEHVTAMPAEDREAFLSRMVEKKLLTGKILQQMRGQ